MEMPHVPDTPSLPIPARSRQIAIPEIIDLEPFYTAALDEDCFGKPGDNLVGFPKGVHAHAKGSFDIRGMIRLAGKHPACNGQEYPEAVKGIPVRQRAERVHLLLGASGSETLDAVIGEIVLHYEDGRTATLPLIYGRNAMDSFPSEEDRVPTDAEVVWRGTTRSGRPIRLYKQTAFNPLPEVAVRAVDFVSRGTGAAPFLIGLTFQPEQRAYEWFDSIRIYNGLVPRSPEATPDQVDLTEYYGTCLDDDWFNHGGHDLHDAPHGLQTLCGVRFDVRGLIVLAGTRNLAISGLALPEEMPGIQVNRFGKALHFLHVSAFGACEEGSGAGARIGEYVVHYGNGETRSIPLLYGQNILDWWVDPAEGRLSDAEEAWIGSNFATRSRGMKNRLVKYTWRNPLPKVEIMSIDMVSAITNSAPMLLAITVEPD